MGLEWSLGYVTYIYRGPVGRTNELLGYQIYRQKV
jgi:hypothetical protein